MLIFISYFERHFDDVQLVKILNSFGERENINNVYILL